MRLLARSIAWATGIGLVTYLVLVGTGRGGTGAREVALWTGVIVLSAVQSEAERRDAARRRAIRAAS